MTGRAGRAGRAWGAAVAAAVALVALAAAGAPAGAQQGPATTAPAAAAPAARIALDSQSSWLHPGDRFDLRLRIAGAPPDAAVRLVVHDSTDSRHAFRRTLDGRLGRVLKSGAPQPLAELPAGPAGTVTAGFVVGAGGVVLPGRGVYPVEVELLSAGGARLDGFVTYLVYLTGPTPEFPPLDVAVVVDVGGAPTLQPDGHAVVDPGTLARVQQRVDVLDRTSGVALTVAPQPETLDGFSSAGGAAAAEVKNLRIAAAGRPLLGRPYVDVDLAALRQAGLTSEARHQVDAGALAVQGTMRAKPVGGVWLSSGTLGSDAAREAVQLGFDKALVPPAALDGGDSQDVRIPQAPVRLGSDGPLAMVSDPALAEHLTGGAGALGAHRFLAELAITWLEAPANRRGVVVRIPADAELDTGAAAVALAGLADGKAGQAVRAVPLERIFADVPAGEDGPDTVGLADHDIAHDLRPIAGPLRAARAGVDGLDGMVNDPVQAVSLRRSLLISTGTSTPDAARAAYVGGVNVTLGTVTGSVVLPEKFRITLTSRSSTIPVTVTNNTRRELKVMVQLDSAQLQFPEGRLISTVLAPGTTRLDVPVRVRTSGAFTMGVRVTSPDGTIVLDSSTFDVRSTAISGVGFLLSIGAALFLAVWWLRHWRSSRRSRHLMPRGATATPVPPGPDAGGDGPGDHRPAHLAARPPPRDGSRQENLPGSSRSRPQRI